METKDRATRVAVLTALRDAIDTALQNDRDDLTDNLKELNNTFGVKVIEVELPNAEKVGTASLSVSEPKPFVNNERLFLDWVQASHPTEIVRAVRPSFQKALFSAIDTTSADEAVNSLTGEVIPGLMMNLGGVERMTLRFNKQGRDLIAAAFTRGELEMIIRSISDAEAIKSMEYLPNENLGDSPANNETIEPQPSGALGS